MPKDKSSESFSEKDRIHPYNKTIPNHGKTHGEERKEWEDATCPICMDFPHNAVLLLCSSHDKGCRPYICNTGHLHSNCLNQYKNAHMGTQKVLGHSEPPPPGINMTSSGEAINLTVEALSVTFVTVSPESGVVVSSRNIASLDESSGIGIASGNLNSVRENGDLIPSSDITRDGIYEPLLDRRDGTTLGIDERRDAPTSGIDESRDSSTSGIDERRDVLAVGMDETRDGSTFGIDERNHDQTLGIEGRRHPQTSAMAERHEQTSEVDERREQTSEADERHEQTLEMDERNDDTSAMYEGYGHTSAMDEREEQISAMDQRRDEHTSVMDERHDQGLAIEESHEQASTINERQEQLSARDERYGPASSIDERHGQASAMDERHVHTLAVDGRHEATSTMDEIQDYTMATDGMDHAMSVSTIANQESSPLHDNNDNVNDVDASDDDNDNDNDNDEDGIDDGEGADECMDEVANMEWSKDLKCPLCRGIVNGWKVVDAAREHLNHRARSCSEESCSFFGTYKELRTHAKSKHPFAHPSEVDPSRLRDWRRLEHQRNVGDVLSSIRAAMPGATIVGDHVLETGLEENEHDGENGNSGGTLLSVPAFLFLHLFAPSTDLGGRIVLPGAWGLRGHRGSGSTRGRQSREPEPDIESNDTDNPDNSSSIGGSSEEQVPGLPPYE